tara:strand:- start:33635 stop:34174 length:540 start_codon:yes stop_codon:yes gene_type:complete
MTLSAQAKNICALSRKELAQVFEDASAVDVDSIAGYRYRGVSLGLPKWIEKLSWKKFAKTFVRSNDGTVSGWNLRIEQDTLDTPWRPQMKRGAEWRFGNFGVCAIPNSPHIEINYGLGTSGLSPLRRLRDPLRSLDKDGDLLLGRSLVDVGIARRLGTPSWFVLERDQHASCPDSKNKS